jgi:hypothetical protein
MPRFSGNIKTSNGNLNFSFNRVYTVEGVSYHVSVVDKERNVIIFHMVEDEGKWKIRECDNCPDYIKKVEKELSDKIKNH